MVLRTYYGVPLYPYQKRWQTSGLKSNKETTLPEEDSAELIFDRNYKSRKRIMLYVNYFTIYPVRLYSQLWTYHHLIANLRFYIR